MSQGSKLFQYVQREAKVWFTSQLDLSFSEPSGSLPDLLSSSQLKILSVVIETEYESDRDNFNGIGYNRFSKISSCISTP